MSTNRTSALWAIPVDEHRYEVWVKDLEERNRKFVDFFSDTSVELAEEIPNSVPVSMVAMVIVHSLLDALPGTIDHSVAVSSVHGLRKLIRKTLKENETYSSGVRKLMKEAGLRKTPGSIRFDPRVGFPEPLSSLRAHLESLEETKTNLQECLKNEHSNTRESTAHAFSTTFAYLSCLFEAITGDPHLGESHQLSALLTREGELGSTGRKDRLKKRWQRFKKTGLDVIVNKRIIAFLEPWKATSLSADQFRARYDKRERDRFKMAVWGTWKGKLGRQMTEQMLCLPPGTLAP